MSHVRLFGLFLFFVAIAASPTQAQRWMRFQTLSAATFTKVIVSDQDSDVLLATVQESAKPLFTTNGGATWQEFRSLPSEWASTLGWIGLVPGTRQTFRLVMDRAVYETSDFGTSYTTVATLPSPSIRNLLIHPTDNTIWFAWSVSPPILRSRDAGATWDTVLRSSFYSMSGPFATPADPAHLIVEIQDTLFESNDTGRTWHSFPHERINNFSIDLLGLDHSIVNRCYANFQGRLSLSEDGGRTWSDRTEKNILSTNGMSQAPGPNGALYAWGTNVLRSLDRGRSWSVIDSTRPTRLSAALVAGRLTVGCYQSGIFQSTVDGQHWTRLDKEVNRLDVHAIIPLSSTEWYVQGVNDVYHTQDAGEHWQELTPVKFDQPSGGRVYSFAVAPSNPLFMLAGTNSDIYRSNDGGQSWRGASPAQNEPIAAISIDPSNPLEIVCGGLYNLKHSEDGGLTWKNDFEHRHRSILSIARSSVAPATILAAEANAVFCSRDGGRSWLPGTWTFGDISGLLADALDASTFYAFGTSGVHVTRDCGTSWTKLGDFLYGVRALVQDPSHPDVFYAAWAGGRGNLLQYTQSTQTLDTLYNPGWEDETFAITMLAIADRTIVAGTPSGFLWFDPRPVSVDQRRATFVRQLAPMPGASVVSIIVDEGMDDITHLDLVDTRGMTVLSITDEQSLQSRPISIDVSRIPVGAFTLRIHTTKAINTAPLLISR